jgi:hypothetical protein
MSLEQKMRISEYTAPRPRHPLPTVALVSRGHTSLYLTILLTYFVCFRMHHCRADMLVVLIY